MRDPDIIDSKLRLIAAVHRSIREHGGEPSSRQVDELLDGRLSGQRPGPARTPQFGTDLTPTITRSSRR
jgi:hypothetical protein